MKHYLAAAALAAALQAGAAGAATSLPPITDPPTTISIPGKFVWFDLVTTEPAAAQAFYGKVFGWTFQAAPGASDYKVFSAGGRPIGGIFQPAIGGGAAPGTRWLSFVSVRDMDAALARLGRTGFTTLLPATKVPGRGTQAIVRDTQGAIVGLLKSASGDPRDEPVAPGEFFWVDLYTHSVASAAAAYAYIGYQVVPAEEDQGDRLMLVANGYARAGIAALPAGRPSGWLPYVQVEDVAATAAAAQAAGGTLLRAPDPAVLEGNIAVIADPLGGIIGIIHWKPEATAEAQP